MRSVLFNFLKNDFLSEGAFMQNALVSIRDESLVRGLQEMNIDFQFFGYLNALRHFSCGQEASDLDHRMVLNIEFYSDKFTSFCLISTLDFEVLDANDLSWQIFW